MTNEKSDAPNPTPGRPADASQPEMPDWQIAELRTMMADLLKTFQEMQAQNGRDAQFRQAASAIQDMRLAARNMLTAPTPAVAEYTAAAHAPADDRGDCSCGCVSERCCCFDIMLSSVRVLAMQPLELDDSNANPWGEMECIIFAYLLPERTGTVAPSLFSPITLRKLLQHPGLQISIDRKIGRVCVPKGKTVVQELGADVVESDSGLIERATGGRDEEGTGRGAIALSCCGGGITPTASFDVSFSSGGQGGGAIGLTFTAIPVCC